jgi:hypothetical protein
MRASLTIGGIEVELSAEKRFEGILARAYAPFLGPVASPACRLQIVMSNAFDSDQQKRLAGRHVRLSHPLFRAEIDEAGHGVVFTAAKAASIDAALLAVFGLIAPSHDALLLQGSGVISGGRADVFVGGPDSGAAALAALAGHRPLLSSRFVLVRRLEDGWVAAGTPFGDCDPGAPRQARLRGLWGCRPWPVIESAPLEDRAALRLVIDHAEIPSPDAASRKVAFDLAANLASAVPITDLAFEESDLVWDEVEHVAVS